MAEDHLVLESLSAFDVCLTMFDVKFIIILTAGHIPALALNMLKTC